MVLNFKMGKVVFKFRINYEKTFLTALLLLLPLLATQADEGSLADFHFYLSKSNDKIEVVPFYSYYKSTHTTQDIPAVYRSSESILRLEENQLILSFTNSNKKIVVATDVLVTEGTQISYDSIKIFKSVKVNTKKYRYRYCTSWPWNSCRWIKGMGYKRWTQYETLEGQKFCNLYVHAKKNKSTLSIYPGKCRTEQ